MRQVWTHLIRSEQQRVSVLVLVSLHPFKETRRIVQHRRRGIQVQRSVRLDLGGCPSSLRVPRDAQHVVREGATEREGRGFRDRLGGGRELNLEERGLQSEEGGQLQFAISVQHLRSGRLSSHSGHLIDSSHSYPANQRLPSLQIHPIQPTQPIPAMLQASLQYPTPHSLPLILSQASRRHDPLFSALPPVSLTSISALPVPCPFIISTWSPTVPSAEPVDVATAGTDRWREREGAREDGGDGRAGADGWAHGHGGRPDGCEAGDSDGHRGVREQDEDGMRLSSQQNFSDLERNLVNLIESALCCARRRPFPSSCTCSFRWSSLNDDVALSLHSQIPGESFACSIHHLLVTLPLLPKSSLPSTWRPPAPTDNHNPSATILHLDISCKGRRGLFCSVF